MTSSAKVNFKTVWRPQPGPQTTLLRCPVFEVLYGGARGGGKTDAMLGDFVKHAGQYGEDAIALCVRRERTQLKEMIERSRQIYTPLGAKYSSQDKQWRFPNGARLTFAYLENDSDAESYQGWNNSAVYIEELGTFPRPEPVFKLMATLRSGNPNVKVKFRATANPGGPGHCVPYGDVLTPNGWVDIRNMRVGDQVYSIGPQRAIAKTTVAQVHQEYYSGSLIEVKTRGLHMEFTPNHKIAYIPGTKNTSPDMVLGTIDHLPGQAVIARSVSWHGADPGPVYAPTIVDGAKVNSKSGHPEVLSSLKFARLLGWFLSEGSIIKRERCLGGVEGIHISQLKPETREKLRVFLSNECGFNIKETDTGFSIYSVAWGSLFRDFSPCKNNYIPRPWLDATSDIQNALFDSLMDGDGHWEQPGRSGAFYSSSSRLSNDFQELAIKLGLITCMKSRERPAEYDICGKKGVRAGPHREYCVYFKSVKSGGTEILTGNHIYRVDTETKRRSDISSKEFSGHVYCIGIDGHHTFILRQNGSAWVSGNSWIKARYIDPAPGGMKILKEKFTNPFTGEEQFMERVFIPSRVVDNKFCNNTDYIARLQLSAGEKLLQAWLHGDWNIVEGAFFAEWDASKHVIEPFAIPANWTRFCSADWGSAAPFSIGWWAVVSDDYENAFGSMSYSDGASAYKGGLPRGAIIRYREWYGSPNHNNVGLKLFAEEVAAGIVEREREEPRNQSGGANIAYRVIDPDACREKGGPSISERMSWAPNRLFWRPADNARVGRRGAMGGWDAVRARLKGENGVPMLYVFDNCTDLIRCLPVAQHDPDNMEDIDDCEDHVIDDLRYACMSRPYVSSPDAKKLNNMLTIGPDNRVTLNDILDQYDHKSPKSYERIR